MAKYESHFVLYLDWSDWAKYPDKLAQLINELRMQPNPIILALWHFAFALSHILPLLHPLCTLGVTINPFLSHTTICSSSIISSPSIHCSPLFIAHHCSSFSFLRSSPTILSISDRLKSYHLIKSNPKVLLKMVVRVESIGKPMFFS